MKGQGLYRKKKKGAKMKFQLIAVLGILLLVSQVSAEENLVLKNHLDKDF